MDTKLKFHKGHLPIIFVLSMFIYIFYIDVFKIIIPWLSYSVPGISNICILCITTLFALFCYTQLVLGDPGSVPHDYQPDYESARRIFEVKKKSGELRYCQKCRCYKPPRSHHCRACQRCILKMDHHCPWTNNCVGHANYHIFFVFLIYMTAALMHSVVLISSHLVHLWSRPPIAFSDDSSPFSSPSSSPSSSSPLSPPPHYFPWSSVALDVMTLMITLVLSLGVALLLIWHLQLASSNRTTIEYMEGVTANMEAVHRDAPDHPYDLGIERNLMALFGDDPCLWFLPPCSPKPGGIDFPVSWNETEEEDEGEDEGEEEHEGGGEGKEGERKEGERKEGEGKEGEKKLKSARKKQDENAGNNVKQFDSPNSIDSKNPFKKRGEGGPKKRKRNRRLRRFLFESSISEALQNSLTRFFRTHQLAVQSAVSRVVHVPWVRTVVSSKVAQKMAAGLVGQTKRWTRGPFAKAEEIARVAAARGHSVTSQIKTMARGVTMQAIGAAATAFGFRQCRAVVSRDGSSAVAGRAGGKGGGGEGKDGKTERHT